MADIINFNQYKVKYVEKAYGKYEDDEIGFITGWIKMFGLIQNDDIEWDGPPLFD